MYLIVNYKPQLKVEFNTRPLQSIKPLDLISPILENQITKGEIIVHKLVITSLK